MREPTAPAYHHSGAAEHGSRWAVFKRWFEPRSLLAELGGAGEVLLAGRWFVLVRTRW